MTNEFILFKKQVKFVDGYLGDRIIIKSAVTGVHRMFWLLGVPPVKIIRSSGILGVSWRLDGKARSYVKLLR